MKRFVVRVVPVVALMFLVAPLVAQQRQPGRGFGGGGGGVGMLLSNKGVQEELKVTDEQKEKVTSSLKDVRTKFGEDMRAAFKDMNREKIAQIQKDMAAETNKVVGKVLKPDQVKRLHQIELQVGIQQGNLGVLTSERVQKELKLTDKQKASIKETSEMLAKDRPMFGGGTRPTPEQREAFQKKAKEAGEKIIGTLSADQKKTWKDLTGEKFNYKPDMRPNRPPQ